MLYYTTGISLVNFVNASRQNIQNPLFFRKDSCNSSGIFQAMLKHPFPITSFRVHKNISEGQMFWLWSRPTFGVRYFKKKKATDTSSIHIHPNFKLKDDLFPRNAFLENNINISSSIFGADKMVWKNTPSPFIRYGPCNKEETNCLPSFSHFSVGWDVPAHREELKADIQKNSFVKTLRYATN